MYKMPNNVEFFYKFAKKQKGFFKVCLNIKFV